MFINKFEELIRETLQYFYADIYSNKEIVKILKEKNFVKYQIEINKILSDYIGSFDKKVLYDIVNDENNINKMFEILQKYIAYYLFFTIAAYYAGNQDNFINNIILNIQMCLAMIVYSSK